MTWWSVGVAVGSAVLNASASRRAAKTQSDAAKSAEALQREMFQKQLELNEPWRLAGANALAKIGTGFTGQVDLTQDPGYAFRLSEGMKALERSAAARGGLLSGGTMRAAQRFGQDLASQEYQNAYNRALTQYNTTAALAGIGQTASNQMAGYAGQMGANVGNLMLQGANARASGYIGTANAISQGLGSLGNYMGGQNYLKMLQAGQADAQYPARHAAWR